MKATLTLTNRGVVTLPAKLRRALGLKADDQLIAETTPRPPDVSFKHLEGSHLQVGSGPNFRGQGHNAIGTQGENGR